MRNFLFSFALTFICCGLFAQLPKDPQHPAPDDVQVELNKNMVQLQWNAPVVAQQTLFYESFESGNIPATWKLYDIDGDGEKWEIHPFTAAHTGSYSVASYSWFNGNALTPDNWLITPQITIPDSAMLEFFVAAVSQSYSQEHYQIKVSTTDTQFASFTHIIWEETLPASNNSWLFRDISLTAFTGQQIYIAFVHNQSTNHFAIKLDDITINQYAKSNPELMGYHVFRADLNSNTATQLTSAIIADTLFTDYPAIDGKYKYYIFAVYDDANWSDTAASDVLWYFDYYSAPSGLSAQMSDNIVQLEWQAPVNTTKHLINEGFEESSALSNWINYDYDGDGEKWELHPHTTAHSGSQSMASYSWFNGNALTPNNWIISNQLPLKGICSLSYWVAPVSNTYTQEHYSVMLSVGGLDTLSFSHTIIDETLPTGNTQWQLREFDISPQAGNNIHVAWVHHDITNQFALKIDDISLQATYQNTGYNVYRKHIDSLNFIKLNVTPVTALNFTDTLLHLANYLYKVTAIYPDNEESNASNIANVNVGMREKELKALSVHIFPNPAKGFINLKIDGSITGRNISFVLYNVTATAVLSGNLNGFPLNEPVIIPLHGVQTGVHVLEVKIGAQVFYKRLIIL